MGAALQHKSIGTADEFETVRDAAARLPFELRDYQAEINIDVEVNHYDRIGLFAEVGTGKTAMATVFALNRIYEHDAAVIVTAPPILGRQWRQWLISIAGVKPDDVVIYAGSPAKRKQVDLRAHRWVVMTQEIFKRDYAAICAAYKDRAAVLLVDEATCIKNTDTDNYRYVKDFCGHAGWRGLAMLTGTPCSGPGDAYAYIKLKTPEVYRSLSHFEALHVGERDYFGNVTKWVDLEKLRENLGLKAYYVRKEEALAYLPRPIYVPTMYDLGKAHMALYCELAEQQILLLEDGGKFDATDESRLYNALQQIICNPDHFSGDASMRPAIFDLIDEAYSEIGPGGKLLVFANYRMTNRTITNYLTKRGMRPVQAYSEISQSQQLKNVAQFISDPACRAFVANPTSAGYGLDGLQGVCSDVLFAELPVVPRHFVQAVGRVFRSGQRTPPTVRLPIAQGTIQSRLHRRLLEKDSLVSKVTGTPKDLRAAIYGGD